MGTERQALGRAATGPLTEEPKTASMAWAPILRFVLLVWALAYLSGLVAMTVHQCIGHNLTALIVGAKRGPLIVSPLVGVVCSYPLSAGAAHWQEYTALAGGIGSNLLFGVLIWAVFLPRARRTASRLAALLVGAFSLIGGGYYLLGGLVGYWGDPGWVYYLPRWSIVASGAGIVMASVVLLPAALVLLGQLKAIASKHSHLSHRLACEGFLLALCAPPLVAFLLLVYHLWGFWGTAVQVAAGLFLVCFTGRYSPQEKQVLRPAPEWTTVGIAVALAYGVFLALKAVSS